MRIVVIVPGSAATGGVELLYQFVDAANQAGAEAYVCNHPFNGKVGIPSAYSGYNCPSILRREIRRGDVVILPEVFTYLVDDFGENDLYLWWMSVDNYYGSRTIRYMAANRFLPWRFKSLKSSKFSKSFKGHLCQSQYAIDHLEEHGIRSHFAVSDYVNRDFVESSGLKQNHNRKDIIVFNPAKGVEQTKKIMSISKHEFLPIQNMTRMQVADLLLSSKIYIDFGNHPGKDRIPREAAALGCVVITNRRGSARNQVDIPIDPDLKIDDTLEDFAKTASRLIDDVIANFESYDRKFHDYRRVIINEKAEFLASVAAFVQAIKA